jgi:hypothetical protein
VLTPARYKNSRTSSASQKREEILCDQDNDGNSKAGIGYWGNGVNLRDNKKKLQLL